MENGDVGSTISALLQAKDVLSLFVVCGLLLYTYVKLLPNLLERESSRSERLFQQLGSQQKDAIESLAESINGLREDVRATFKGLDAHLVEALREKR